MKRRIALVLVAILVLTGLSFQGSILNNIKSQNNAYAGPFALALEQPSGVNSAFPEDRAQISAYIKLNQAIDLNAAGRAFSQLEEAGDNYIIGQVTIEQKITDPDYDLDWEFGLSTIHVYVDNTGWIVAYLERTEPVGAIIYWSNVDLDYPSITETTLSMAIKVVCDQIGVNYNSLKDNVRYYDFQYPSATKMLVAINTLTSGEREDVHLEIPSSYTLYRAGYSIIGSYTDVYVDGNRIDYLYYVHYNAGDFDIENVLTTGTGHTISFQDKYGGGIVLIYSEG